MTRLLGFDPGRTFGVAAITPETDMVYCEYSWVTEGRGLFFLKLEELTCRLVRSYRPSAIIYERPFFRGGGSPFFMGFTAILEMVAARFCLDGVIAVPPAELKKSLTGSGKASKKDVIAVLNKRDIEVTTEHEADAVSAVIWGLANYVPSPVPERATPHHA